MYELGIRVLCVSNAAGGMNPDFRIGDIIETSGYSAIFPPGIVVGQVLHVYNSSDGLSYKVQVHLSTDFGNLRDVCIIDNSVMKERMQLLNAAQDSLKLKQN